jgi:hypothetical protein
MPRPSLASALALALILSTLPSLASAADQSIPLGEPPGLLLGFWDAVLDFWKGLPSLPAPDKVGQDLGVDPEPGNSGDLGPGLDPAG